MTTTTALGLHLGHLGGFHGGGLHGGSRIGSIIVHAAIWVAIRRLFEAYPEILWPIVAIVVIAIIVSVVRRRRRRYL
jgi:hypothetical protein